MRGRRVCLGAGRRETLQALLCGGLTLVCTSAHLHAHACAAWRSRRRDIRATWEENRNPQEGSPTTQKELRWYLHFWKIVFLAL